MLIVTGNGRLTRSPELRHTNSGKPVTTVTVASDRRDRDSEPVYVDLIVWDAQAEAAAEHLVKGQAVTFSGRLEPRTWETQDGGQRTAIEIHNVTLEYGAKPRDRAEAAEAAA